MKKNQEEVHVPNEGGSGKQKVKRVSNEFIYFAVIVLTLAGLLVVLAS